MLCKKCILSIKFGNCSYFTLSTLTSGVLPFFSIWRCTKGIGVNWRNRNSTNARCIIYDTWFKSEKDGIFENFLWFCSYFEVTNPHGKNHDSPPSINRVGHCVWFIYRKCIELGFKGTCSRLGPMFDYKIYMTWNSYRILTEIYPNIQTILERIER